MGLHDSFYYILFQDAAFKFKIKQVIKKLTLISHADKIFKHTLKVYILKVCLNILSAWLIRVNFLITCFILNLKAASWFQIAFTNSQFELDENNKKKVS